MDKHRFVYRRGAYLWVHPATVKTYDYDLTDMNDAEFEAFVRARESEQ